ncbi:mandelate racemase/muconate lactonizing enzyme family protein [Flavonifractor plautii]|uniref:Mandelate racemase/muconate lactonizing enzyme family protein n=4 Tax=Flavonifractor plautii TaxID=292800 RepID=A0A6I2RL58_FLAPL|nr:mandelate racemase/muconate lactonizing enzyme family protein [Flavonifractor plautii]MCG4707154.1 mandelate racemase/muconate lactonizing enzyme family protein [Flavonifractor plautii]MDB7924968.1 mandelate racemase/muconate lactonizing enzyme family protein [Flavonifractor plautii]MDB7930506.1 mandelate racemase/muconate lactonizing enzyme family protein [Flavonifractor plautii]MDB7935351.1 mandelate racemase/muconate lactonizing enzyme family protein [Flavonifractor plautii]MDB7940358.1 
MKITQIDIMTPRIQENPMWRPILCRIHTDEGIYGDGEAALAYGIASPAAAGMIRDLATLIIGMDPLDSEVIWDKLYKSTFWGQNGGPVVFAGISALDIALWDIKGKAFNVPVYKLLGGKRRDNLRTYASQLQFGWSDHAETLTTLDEYREVSKKAVAEGYDAIKIDFLTYAPEDGRRYTDEDCTRLLSPKLVDVVESRVAAVREAIGPNVDIIMENHSRPDAQSAVQLGRAVQKYNIFYFEEPNTPNPKTAKFISSKLSMPIAHGERVYSRWQYAPFFEDQSIQVIQPDLGNCGGLTEGKKICDMAYVYDISVQAHVCASPLSTAVALHLESVIPNFVIHEHHTNNLKPWNKELCTVDWQPVDGKFKVPEGPGLGCEFTDKVLNTENKIIVK